MARTFHRPINKTTPERRTYDDVLYASLAECSRAQYLDALILHGLCDYWTRQVPFRLGPDTVYRCDFLCWLGDDVWAEDVKGFETPAWRRTIKLWKKYGPVRLVVVKKRGANWDCTTVIESTISKTFMT